MIGCAKLGMHFAAVAPVPLFPNGELVEKMRSLCETTGGSITITDDIKEGVRGADALYTDVWVSMGEEARMEERIQLLRPYQVNQAMVNATENPDVIFLHCLPSFHDDQTVVGKNVKEKYGLEAMEVTDEVFQADYSKVFDEAENRMHTIKAVMCASLANTQNDKNGRPIVY